MDYNIRASRGDIQLSFKRIQDILLDVDSRIAAGGGGGGGSTTWGSITGTLGSQTDLANALSGKQAAGSYASSVHTHTISDVTGLQTALDGKSDALVSGTSIKTINGTSLLGAGDISIASGGITLSSTTVTLPSGRGVYEYSAVVTDATVSSEHLITCQLAPHIDSDENATDMLSLRSVTAVAGNGNFTVNMAFDEPTSGIIKLRYFKS